MLLVEWRDGTAQYVFAAPQRCVAELAITHLGGAARIRDVIYDLDADVVERVRVEDDAQRADTSWDVLCASLDTTPAPSPTSSLSPPPSPAVRARARCTRSQSIV